MTDIIPSFSQTLEQHELVLQRKQAQILQVNMGRLCNQTCKHCHLAAGPDRKEIMDLKTIDQVIDYQKKCAFKVVDITGGAPEMNPNLIYFIEALSDITGTILLRSNLSALFDLKDDCLISVLKKNRVIIVSSFPSLNQAQADSQRGKGVFDKSIQALILLNQHGYGQEGTGLTLNLVSNPTGAYLPSSQKATEKRYRHILDEKWGIVFNNAYSFANMPLGRFEDWLKRSGNYDAYMANLYKNFNPCTISELMCRNLISISWDGFLFDCDFNLAANLYKGNEKKHLSQTKTCSFVDDKIATDNHCYACAAGSGFT
ncbi:MAG: arsenosugar biosynthesis radical SAM protein ArsS [Proteobacteria bacterium]|nr:arsenosugar biosynthesis radical SAM protein ArsS [Pseudomonadota bacterium]MBU1586134.1 arsenosugar biosynthesis radical SAM protein ArsS [Pseudomonadota bacterium]MBU2631080.1 arsenosugar biosynthesis radical SAM protein ArsS [Pseudomonadota bacterium]